MSFNIDCQDQLVKTLSRQYGDSDQLISRYSNGSAAVYRIGADRVLKLYDPSENYDAEIELEKHCLNCLYPNLDGYTPQLIDFGTVDGIQYIVMSLLEGEDLIDVWSDISLENKLDLFKEAGNLARSIHSVDVTELSEYGGDWASFISQQLVNCKDNQIKAGLRDDWIEQINPWLDSIDWTIEKSKQQVILHTEIMRDHLKVKKVNGEWKLSGIFDFGDAMVGTKEYDFVAVGCLATGGNKEFLSAFFSGYGDKPDKDFTRLAMAYLLIHKYSNIEWFLNYVPIKNQPGSLEELADAWYSCIDD